MSKVAIACGIVLVISLLAITTLSKLSPHLQNITPTPLSPPSSTTASPTDTLTTLGNIFSGKTKYQNTENGVYYFESSLKNGGIEIRTYKYDPKIPSIPRTAGFGDGVKVIYDLSKEINTFKNLGPSPKKASFFSYYLGEGYLNIIAHKKTIGTISYAIYDSCSRYAGQWNRNYFTFDNKNSQLIYITLPFTAQGDRCPPKNSDTNEVLLFEKEILAQL
jgi:hypothetical protein